MVCITGPLGAGKSSLVAAMVAELRRPGQRVAVVAADPASPFTGGAILGDRIRTLQSHDDPGVFIRSMANRGAMGGLAPATHDVARLAQITVVVLAPGMGDAVQAIKAGIL